VPILLLNESSSDKESRPGQSSKVNSLSLSQTEEATTIARRALAQGQKQAIVIVPDSDWGTRMGAAFSMIYEQGEGNIVSTTRFDTQVSDHSAMLTRLLKIDESEQRKTDLQSRLGIPLEFEPSRRDDFDFIFLAASPIEGRQIKPLLRFHDAGDVPVYAMGRIFSGKTDSAIDQDLNGIVFPATPWQLAAERGSSLAPDSIRGGSFGNLYALGKDAWRLLPWLPLMQKDPDLWFPGEVGSLRLLTDGQLFREPAWAQFSDGVPVAYQWPDNP
jgi:outer membrane PBP1 activator LpoA protein